MTVPISKIRLILLGVSQKIVIVMVSSVSAKEVRINEGNQHQLNPKRMQARNSNLCYLVTESSYLLNTIRYQPLNIKSGHQGCHIEPVRNEA